MKTFIYNLIVCSLLIFFLTIPKVFSQGVVLSDPNAHSPEAYEGVFSPKGGNSFFYFKKDGSYSFGANSRGDLLSNSRRYVQSAGSGKVELNSATYFQSNIRYVVGSLEEGNFEYGLIMKTDSETGYVLNTLAFTLGNERNLTAVNTIRYFSGGRLLIAGTVKQYSPSRAEEPFIAWYNTVTNRVEGAFTYPQSTLSKMEVFAVMRDHTGGYLLGIKVPSSDPAFNNVTIVLAIDQNYLVVNAIEVTDLNLPLVNFSRALVTGDSTYLASMDRDRAYLSLGNRFKIIEFQRDMPPTSRLNIIGAYATRSNEAVVAVGEALVRGIDPNPILYVAGGTVTSPSYDRSSPLLLKLELTQQQAQILEQKTLVSLRTGNPTGPELLNGDFSSFNKLAGYETASGDRLMAMLTSSGTVTPGSENATATFLYSIDNFILEPTWTFNTVRDDYFNLDFNSNPGKFKVRTSGFSFSGRTSFSIRTFPKVIIAVPADPRPTLESIY